MEIYICCNIVAKGVIANYEDHFFLSHNIYKAVGVEDVLEGV